KIEGKIEDICKFMVRKFNADAGEVMERIQRLTNLEILDGLMEELFAANTLEEAQFIIKRVVVKSLQ
ncbi:MAG TPA: transposase, partial [Desulfotomaculum sp.]|nr:transposase [Desulfotomaculum sp.]